MSALGVALNNIKGVVSISLPLSSVGYIVACRHAALYINHDFVEYFMKNTWHCPFVVECRPMVGVLFALDAYV
jgi:hypothetical protein